MIVLRNKSFSNKKEKKEDYTKEAVHTGLAVANGAIASHMTRNLVKKGAKNKKLAGAGMIIAAGNTGYHAYKAADGIEKKRKRDKKFSDSEKKNSGVVTNAGKVVGGIGTAGLVGAEVAGGVAGYKAARAADRIAVKTGTTRVGGYGVIGGAPEYIGANAQKAANLHKRYINKVAPTVKKLGKAEKIGAVTTLAGAGLYAAGKLIDKKKNKE